MVHVAGCKIPDAEHEGICRDGRGSPRIILPDGRKVLSYSRASSYGDALDDKSNLIAWSQANALRGAIAEPPLLDRFGQVDDGWVTQEAKDAAKRVIEDLARAGGSEVKADKGTNVHAWTELLDKGHDLNMLLEQIPDEHYADLMAYAWVTEDYEHLLIEQFCVLDSHKVAGTPDRVTRMPGLECPDCGFDVYIWDLKTGRVSFAQKMAVQLAIYSRSQLYTQEEQDGTVYGLRQALPELCQHRGVILNLPAGSGQADLYWVDIDAGWHAVENEIPAVKAWRKRDVLTPLSV
jgi:hypothetical protein